MCANRNISSNSFGPNAKIHQGDSHYYSPNASRKAYFVVPFPPNENIIRRPDIDAQLDELLSSSKGGQYCSAALWGLSGSGKTQIALDCAYRRSHEDPDCDIFWVHADSETSFMQDYKTIARKLGLDSELDGEELFLEVHDHIESLQRWLLILDNADDVTRFGIGATDYTKSLLKFIPGGPGGTVLWTSRDEQIVDLVGAQRGVQIAHMDTEEAENLLATTRKMNIGDDETQDVRQLLQELQWLPLAISQAGSFMRKTSTPIKEYLSQLREARSRWDMLKMTQHDRHRRPDVSNSILETLDIALKHIGSDSPMAIIFLCTIAYIDTQNIPLSVILTTSTFIEESKQEESSGNKERAVNAAIIRLKEFSFIIERKTESGGERSFDMHKLVQDAIRYRLNTDDTAWEAPFSTTALRVISSLFPKEVKKETLLLCEKYATHAICVSDWAEMSENVTKTCKFLWRVADYFHYCGMMKKAEYITKKALNLMRKIYGNENDKTISLVSKLAVIYFWQGNYEEAERLNLEAATLAEKIFGEKHESTLAIKSSLASIYYAQRRRKEAEVLQVKVLSLQRELSGEKHLTTIFFMTELASTYTDQQRYDEAIELRIKALELYSEILGEKHPDTVKAMVSLAEAYMLVGQFKEAKQLELKFPSLEQSWEKYINEYGAKPHITPVFWERLASKRIGLRRRFLSLRLGRFGEMNVFTIKTADDLAKMRALRNAFKEAEELQRMTQALESEALGEKSDRTVTTMAIRVLLMYMQLSIDKGEHLEAQVIALIRESHGDKPPTWLQKELDIMAYARTVACERLREKSAMNDFYLPLLEILAYKAMTGWTFQVFFILLLASGSIVTTLHVTNFFIILTY
ncbi:P-loop containing nucleoside triphosphate hydrolase protein [Trichoderma sp. SZMC 28011]